MLNFVDQALAEQLVWARETSLRSLMFWNFDLELNGTEISVTNVMSFVVEHRHFVGDKEGHLVIGDFLVFNAALVGSEAS